MNCRCRQCGARRTLRGRPEAYVRVPRCRRCGSAAWRVDRYRMEVEKKVRPCRCVSYYPFPHRRGSGWCIHNTSWTAEDAERVFGR